MSVHLYLPFRRSIQYRWELRCLSFYIRALLTRAPFAQKFSAPSLPFPFTVLAWALAYSSPPHLSAEPLLRVTIHCPLYALLDASLAHLITLVVFKSLPSTRASFPAPLPLKLHYPSSACQCAISPNLQSSGRLGIGDLSAARMFARW